MNIKIIPDLGLMLKALGMLREHLAKTNMDHSTRILQITEECDPEIVGRRCSCGYQAGYYIPLTMSYERLFAEFFGIDLNLIEKERRALLKELRQNK